MSALSVMYDSLATLEWIFITCQCGERGRERQVYAPLPRLNLMLSTLPKVQEVSSASRFQHPRDQMQRFRRYVRLQDAFGENFLHRRMQLEVALRQLREQISLQQHGGLPQHGGEHRQQLLVQAQLIHQHMVSNAQRSGVRTTISSV